MRNAMAAAALLLALTGQASAKGGYDFRNFTSNPPKTGEKAPDWKTVDEKGKQVALSEFLGSSHLVLVFGALT